MNGEPTTKLGFILSMLREWGEASQLPPYRSGGDLGRYRCNLADWLIRVHRQFLPRFPDVQLAHVQYRSLVLQMLPDSGSSDVRCFFSATAGTYAELERFAELAQAYESGRDILPDVDCDFCSIRFSVSKQSDSEESPHSFSISAGGIDVLCRLLREQEFQPWTIPDATFDSAFQEFANRQGSFWTEVCASGPYKQPRPKEAFQFAVNSALVTLLTLRADLFEDRLRLLQASRDQIEELRRSRTDVLSAHSTSIEASLSERTLTFVPIRMRRAPGNQPAMETIGLIAFYSQAPLPIDAAAELAVLESLLFLSCRQYELFGIRGTLSEQLANLKLQELHARLMAHEATKTLGGIRDALDLIQQATYDSEGPLGRLARGDLGQLRGKANVDLHTVVVEIHERLAARMDKRHVRFDDRIPPRTFAFVDKDAIRYTLGILIDNASVHGGGLVRIWAEHCSSSDGIGLLVVRVANNGGPMPPQTEADIRNGSPPVRGLKTGQHDEGYGAGLHLAFQFSHLNGWILAYHRVDNDPEGLTHLFSLELPVQA